MESFSFEVFFLEKIERIFLEFSNFQRKKSLKFSEEIAKMPVHPQDPSLISFSSSNSNKTETKNKYKLKFQVWRVLKKFSGIFSENFLLQKLQEENSKLQESLEGKNKEISSLNNRIAKLTNSIDSLTLECSVVSSAKVRDLLKLKGKRWLGQFKNYITQV